MSKLILENKLSGKDDIRDLEFIGNADISFPEGALRIETKEGEAGLLSTGSFPSDVRIEWEFKPLSGDGRAALIFAYKNAQGDEAAEDILGSGSFFELSFYSRKGAVEKAFHVSKLTKNDALQSFEVALGADPLPNAGVTDEMNSQRLDDGGFWYKMAVIKNKDKVYFSVNDLDILGFVDDGMKCGDLLTGGRIGFKQEGKMSGEYRNLKVTWI